MDVSLPVQDLSKVGAGGFGGLGIAALFFRYLRGDISRVERQQATINDTIFKNLNAHADKLSAHETNDAEKFVKREEFTALRDHIDGQFKDQRDFLISLLHKK